MEATEIRLTITRLVFREQHESHIKILIVLVADPLALQVNIESDVLSG